MATELFHIDFEQDVPGKLSTGSALLSEDSPLEGKRSLRFDSFASSGSWTELYRLPLPPGAYRIRFDYRFADAAPDSYLTLFIKPAASTDESSADHIVHQNYRHTYEPDTIRTTRFEAELSNIPGGWLLVFSAKKRIRCTLDQLVIEQNPPATFLAPGQELRGGCAHFAPASGPAAFEIAAPAPSATAPRLMADRFGLSPNAADNLPALKAALAEAKRVGAASLRIPPGRYRLTNSEPLTLSGFKDFTLEAEGVELLCAKPQGDLVSLSNNERVLINGLTVDWDDGYKPLASAARLAACGPRGEYLDFEISYPTTHSAELPLLRTLEELDPATGSPGAEGSASLGLQSSPRDELKREWLDEHTLRVWARDAYARARYARLQPGHLFRLTHFRYEHNAFLLKDNANLTLREVTVYGAPGHAFLNGGDQHHWQLLGCRIIRRPGSARPITCTGDHFHVSGSQGFVRLADCEFSWGTDDGFNIYDSLVCGFRLGERSLALSNARLPFRAGDPLEAFGFELQPLGVVGRIAAVSPDRYRFGGECAVTLQEPLPAKLPPAMLLANRRFASGNVVIERCFFHDNNSKGIVIGAPNTRIEGCRFQHTRLTALLVSAGYWLGRWQEGSGASNLVFRNNRISNCHIDGSLPPEGYSEQAAPLYVGAYLGDRLTPHLRPRQSVFKDLLIEGNRFTDCPGAALFLSGCERVLIRSNVFEHLTPRRTDFPFRGRITLDACHDIRIEGNRWEGRVLTPQAGLRFDPVTVQAIDFRDNH